MPIKNRPRTYELRQGEDTDRLTVYVPRKSLAEFRRSAKKHRVSVSQLASEAFELHLERLRKSPVAS